MNWKPISEATDDVKYGTVLHVHHPDFIDEDFNKEGVIEAICIESGIDDNTDSWLGAIWDNDQDCWNTVELDVVPTHFIVLTKPEA